MTQHTQLPENEFCGRFVAQMIATVGATYTDEDDKTSSTEVYARETAPTYWQEQHLAGYTPEECADSDISYWGD